MSRETSVYKHLTMSELKVLHVVLKDEVNQRELELDDELKFMEESYDTETPYIEGLYAEIETINKIKAKVIDEMGTRHEDEE